MYLQLIELWHFVHYFSHWLMLILQLNVLLVYIFKVASGCDFIFFFLGFVLKHYQGWGADRDVCSCLFLTHPVSEWSLTRGCCKVLSSRRCGFLLVESSQPLIWTWWSFFTHLTLASFLRPFLDRPMSWVVFSPSSKYNCCHRAMVTPLSLAKQVRSPWAWEEKS